MDHHWCLEQKLHHAYWTTVMSHRHSQYCSVIYDEKILAIGSLADSDSAVALCSGRERMGYKASPVHLLTYRLCRSIQLPVRRRADHG